MGYITLMALVYFGIVLTEIIINYKKNFINPTVIFLCLQTIMFVGLLRDPRILSDNGILLIFIYLTALVFFILGTKLSELSKYSTGRANNDFEYVLNEPTKSQLKRIVLLIVISIVLSTLFFVLGGGNVFVESIKDLFGSENTNYAIQRKGFFMIPGVGYIYQFRVVILPILTAFLAFGSKKYQQYGIILFPIMFLFILGTGQRNAFIFYFTGTLIYMVALKRHFNIRQNKTIIALMVTLGIASLILLTISLGRVGNSENILIGAIDNLFYRILDVNSRSAITAFNYIQTQPTVWGYDWLMMLMDILPGKSGYLSVDRIVFYIAYGTYSGTGPPCIWGSAWYNWSWFGVTLFPFVLGFIYQHINWLYKKRKKHTRLTELFYIYLSVYLGFWFSGSPMQIINNGIITIILMKLIIITRVKWR
ncbi:MAG: O-antigen polymerase [Ignavibacteria bacterium]|nr:O-antigen polymerase [Ignavibacteria bacterium]